jgi:hypothetical protein
VKGGEKKCGENTNPVAFRSLLDNVSFSPRRETNLTIVLGNTVGWASRKSFG